MPRAVNLSLLHTARPGMRPKRIRGKDSGYSGHEFTTGARRTRNAAAQGPRPGRGGPFRRLMCGPRPFYGWARWLRRGLGMIYRVIYHGVGWLARERRISASDRHHSERRQRREHGYREGSGVTQGWVAVGCLGPYGVRTCTSPILPRLPWRTSWVSPMTEQAIDAVGLLDHRHIVSKAFPRFVRMPNVNRAT
jgi:hypothetical protein